jgi:hypothetical protein
MQFHSENFIATAISVNASATATNGSEFTSREQSAKAQAGQIIITFTRAAGSSSLTVDFYFQISFDGGTTWADYVEGVGVETGHAVISGTTVRVSRPISLAGCSHIRLAKIVNNDTANNLTAVNAAFSY